MYVKKNNKNILGLLMFLGLPGMFAYGVEVTTNATSADAAAATVNAINMLSDRLGELESSFDTSLTNMQYQMKQLFQGYLGMHDFNNGEYSNASYVIDKNSNEKMSHLRGTLKGLLHDYYFYANNIPAGGNVVSIFTKGSDASTGLKLTMFNDVNDRKSEIIRQLKYNDLNSWPESSVYAYGLLSSQDEIDKVTVHDLLDVDGYSDDGKVDTVSTGKKARTFITEILKSTPPSTEIIFNDKSKVITLPLENDNGSDTTKLNMKDDYDKAITFLKGDKHYKDYVKKVSQSAKLRSVFAETLINAYQERVRINVDNVSRSLVEREKEMALRGINQDYYNNLKNKSAAEVNLEILYALNKNAYFLHRLHKDNEKLRILLATAGLQISRKSLTDDINYLKPIKVLIDNKCWLDENVNSDYCKNPKSAAMTDTGVEVDQATADMFKNE